LRGAAGERLRAVRIRGVTAIVGEVKRTPSPSIRNLRRHTTVIEALARSVDPILPTRFATCLADDLQLAEAVSSRAPMLKARLRSVRRRAQMTIRLVSPPVAQRRPTSGTEYLRQRRVTVPAFEPVRAAIEKYIRESRVERSGDVVTIAHLIPRTAVKRYRAGVERAATENNVRLMLTGPWPPFAFADNW
jgi:hypothetical protein